MFNLLQSVADILEAHFPGGTVPTALREAAAKGEASLIEGSEPVIYDLDAHGVVSDG